MQADEYVTWDDLWDVVGDAADSMESRLLRHLEKTIGKYSNPEAKPAPTIRSEAKRGQRVLEDHVALHLANERRQTWEAQLLGILQWIEEHADD